MLKAALLPDIKKMNKTWTAEIRGIVNQLNIGVSHQWTDGAQSQNKDKSLENRIACLKSLSILFRLNIGGAPLMYRLLQEMKNELWTLELTIS